MSDLVWIIGAGQIAKVYAEILIDLKQDFAVIGKSKKETNFFEKKYKVKTYSGGLSKFQKKDLNIKNVIVATSISSLYSCCIILLKLGATNILLEKPGALSINELKKIKKLSNQKKSNVHIAYNRDFNQ